MNGKTIRLVAGACVVFAAAAVYLAVSYLDPAVYVASIVGGQLLALLACTYFVISKTSQTSRRHNNASADRHKATHLSLQNLEASRARAAVKIQKTISQTAAGIRKIDGAVSDSEAARARAAKMTNEQVNALLRALSDSEAARARAARKTNEQVNAVLRELKFLVAAADNLERISTSSRDLVSEEAKSRSDMLESFTKHSIQVEMYLTEIQEGLSDSVPSYKEEVLAKVLNRAG